jgi:integrase
MGSSQFEDARGALVWLPDQLATLIEQARTTHQPGPDWPLLWDCSGHGYARREDPSAPITPKTLNGVLERARDKAGLQVHVTAHTAKHSYCTNWINEWGSSELAMEKLSRQVGTSVTNLRRSYVHLSVTDADWLQIRSFGSR